MILEFWKFKHGNSEKIHLLEPIVNGNTLCGYAIDADYEQDGFEAIESTTEKINCGECLEMIRAIKSLKI